MTSNEKALEESIELYEELTDLEEEIELLKAEISFLKRYWGLDDNISAAAWDQSISKKVVLDKLALHKQQGEVFLEDTDERSCTKHEARQEACRAFKEDI